MPEINTIAEHLYWSYANLGMYETALKRKDESIGRLHFMIRSKLYKGLTTDKMKVASLFRDEQTKLKLTKVCYYCGEKGKLSLDHIIPRKKGGPDSGDNLIFSCKTCNSSKGSKDLMEWMESKDRFPTILVLRRYLKLVMRFCSENNLLDKPLSELDTLDLPFSIKKIPLKYPILKDIKLWVTDLEEYQNRIDYL